MLHQGTVWAGELTLTTRCQQIEQDQLQLTEENNAIGPHQSRVMVVKHGEANPIFFGIRSSRGGCGVLVSVPPPPEPTL